MRPVTTTPPARSRRRALPVGAVLSVIFGLMAAGCSASAAPTSSTSRTTAAGRTVSTTPPFDGGKPTLDAPGQRLATLATVTYRVQLSATAAGFTSATNSLQADVASGDLGAARTDELTAQADYDAIRTLQSSAPADVPHIDELSSEVAPGQSFTGLHAVERDLWASGPLATDVADLVGQTPIQHLLMARPLLVVHQQFSPEAIGTAAVNELTWVVDEALVIQQEQYSHLGLVDVDATIAAADQAFTDIEPLSERVDPNLTATVATDFAALQSDDHALGDPTSVVDGAVTADARLQLARQLDATASTLARLTALLTPYGTNGGGS